MFGLIFALICIVPNIYLFFRIRKVFIGTSYRIWYALVYLLLVLDYPINNLLIEGNFELKYNLISLVARYILPYYLYVFLLMLLFDSFLLLNRLLKTVSTDTLKSLKSRIIAFSALLIVPLGIDVFGIFNFNNIQTTEYKVVVPRKSARIDHLKIAFVADFHLKERTDIHFVERFADKIAQIQPDLMLFGGDIVEGIGEGKKLDRIAKMFREIKTKYGVFAVLGNHEAYGVQRKGGFFDRAGMTVLSDSVVSIDHAFSLAGRLDNKYEREPIGVLMKSASDSLPAILMDHRPTDIVLNSKTAVDIQFSGHTHNGQLFPLNLILKNFYPLSWGYRKVLNTNVFVTSGIMLWGPPVRTVGKSEIVVVEVEFK